MKSCPFCAEPILDAATVCKHCRRDVRPEARQLRRVGWLVVGVMGAALVVGALAFVALVVVTNGAKRDLQVNVYLEHDRVRIENATLNPWPRMTVLFNEPGDDRPILRYGNVGSLQTVTLDLEDFRRARTGNRFNPQTERAPREFVIEVPGYERGVFRPTPSR